MSTVMAMVLYCVGVSAVLALGALAWENSARHAGRAARWSWLAAMAGALVLPWALRLLPERALESIAVMGPVLTLDALNVGYATSSSSVDYSVLAVAGWATVSLLMLVWLGVMLVRLQRARREWTPAELDGHRVLLSQRTGPAAVGVLRGAVVLPQWVMELDAGLRALLLDHEREHVRAGDPALVLSALVLLALMPWNPVMWVMALRLRNAIELDCDARVLRAGADPRRYGSLLLEVGSRRAGHSLVMATFSEPRLFLEQRIRRIAAWPQRRRPMLAAGFAIAAVALFVSTVSARDLLAPADAGSTAQDADRVAQDVTVETNAPAAEDLVMVSDTPPTPGERPVLTPMDRPPVLQNAAEVQAALTANYPPLLRDAGIGGTAMMWFHLNEEGAVVRTQLSETSGYNALDEAAIAVARVMKFRPAQLDGKPVPVWVQVPVQFRAESATTVETAPARAVAATAAAPLTVEERRVVEASAVARGSVAEERRIVEASAVARGSVAEERRIVEASAVARGSVAEERRAVEATAASNATAPKLLNPEATAKALAEHYPSALRAAGIGGTPSVQVLVDVDGTVSRVQLAKSSGYPALDEAALRVVTGLLFEPATIEGRPVRTWVELPVEFTNR